MAQLECKGIEELTKQLKNLQLNSEKNLIKDMLKAGEKPVVQAWKDSINRVTMPRGTIKTYVHIRRMKFHRFKMKSRSTGNTANAVAGNIRLNKTAVGTDDIYPKGSTKDRNKNVRYAEIAFILHYGKQGQAPTNFVDTAVDGCEKNCVDEMDKVFNQYLEKNNLI